MCQILEQPPSPAASEQPKQRDEKGRFAAGNSGGPGNPFGRRVAELRKAMLNAVSAIEIAAIIQALVVKAMTGDVQAAKVVLSYTVGKPDTMKDPDRVDVEEWALHKETLPMGKELIDVMNQPTPDMPLKMVNYSKSAIGFLQQKQLEGAYDKKEKKSEPAPSTNGDFSHVAQAARLGEETPIANTNGTLRAGEPPTPRDSIPSPSTNGNSADLSTPLPRGSFTHARPGMKEFYQTLVERGYARPIAEDDLKR